MLRRAALAPLMVLLAAGCAALVEGGSERVGAAEQANTKQCPPDVVEGIDVYDGDGTIDWAKVAASGRKFAFIKATQGTYNKQSKFAANWKGAKAAGILRSAYHFFDPSEDGVAQAQAFLAAMGPLEPGDLPPLLDFECPTSSDPNAASPNCEYKGNSGWASPSVLKQRTFDWLDTVEKATGKKPIVYSYPSWFADAGLTDPALAKYPLFIATLGSCASVPAPWSEALFWQYDWSGQVPGISSDCDLDRFMGKLADLQALAQGGASSDGPMVDVADRLQTTDVNGDGKADLCARAAKGVRCWPSKGGGEFDASFDGPALADADGWGDPKYGSTLRFLDLDGDGKADLCARGKAGVTCYLSTGSGFGAGFAGPTLSDASGWGDPKFYATIRVADVNGDGKDDLCARAAKGILCWPSNGHGFDPPIDGPALSDAAGWGDPKFYSTLRAGDVDGDGKDDLCARGAKGLYCWLSDGAGFPKSVTGPAWADAVGWSDPAFYTTIQLADLDGDGKADVCARAAKGVVCELSKGDAFGGEIAGPAWGDGNGWSDPANYTTIRLADVDGDGKLDACGRADAGLVCARFDGAAFAAAAAGPKISDANDWGSPEYYGTVRVVDVDGDGAADLVARAKAGVMTWPSSGGAFGAMVAGPPLSDASGWADAKYRDSMRLVAPRRKKAEPPPDGGAGGAASGGAGGATATASGGAGGATATASGGAGGATGVTTMDPWTPTDDAAGSGSSGGCGCEAAGATRDRGAIALAAALAALALARRRRSAG
jgi:MYXO-CTERM domain-containing protein